MIYLNCAATSHERPPEVGEAVLRALEGFGSYDRGAGDEDLDATRLVFRTREKLCDLLGFSHPERVCFTSGATQALNTAILGLPRRHGRVVATDWDHNAVLRPLARLADEQGVQVDFVSAGSDGALDYDASEALLAEPCDYVVCTHASNVTGMVSDVWRIVAAAHAHGVPVVLDAAQTAGSLPLSMEALGVDVLCVTGHKGLMGPTGTGAILVAPGIEMGPLIEGGTGVLSAERRQPAVWPEHLEAGTLNICGIAGLGAALDWLGEVGIETILDHEQALLVRFLEGLGDIPGIEVYGRCDMMRTPVVSLNLDGVESSVLAERLAADHGIATRAGLHCAPRMHAALGTLGTGAVRFSFNWFTGEEDISFALFALRSIAGAL